jgi:hypothetical protein
MGEDAQEVVLPRAVMIKIKAEIADYGPDVETGVVARAVLDVLGEYLHVVFKEEEDRPAFD